MFVNRIVYLSAAIIPADGFYYERFPYDTETHKRLQYRTVDKSTVELIEQVSYVGHPITATFMQNKTEHIVEVNRGNWVPRAGDLAICATTKPGMRMPPATEVVDITILEECMTLSFIYVLDKTWIEIV